MANSVGFTSSQINLFEHGAQLTQLLRENRFEELIQLTGENPRSKSEKHAYAVAKCRLALKLEGSEKEEELKKLDDFIRRQEEPLDIARAVISIHLEPFELDHKGKMERIRFSEEVFRSIPQEQFPQELIAFGALILVKKSLLVSDGFEKEKLLNEALKILDFIPEDRLNDEEKTVLSFALCQKAALETTEGEKKSCLIRAEKSLTDCPASQDKSILELTLLWLKVSEGDVGEEEALRRAEESLRELPPERCREFHVMVITPKVSRALDEKDVGVKQKKIREIESILEKLPKLDIDNTFLLGIQFQMALTFDGEEKRMRLLDIEKMFKTPPVTEGGKLILSGVQLQLCLFLEGEELKEKLTKLEIFIKENRLKLLNHIGAAVQINFVLFEKSVEEQRKRVEEAMHFLSSVSEDLPYHEYAATKANALVIGATLEDTEEKKFLMLGQAREAIQTIPEKERTQEELEALENCYEYMLRVFSKGFKEATSESNREVKQEKLKSLEKQLVKLPSNELTDILRILVPFQLSLTLDGVEKKEKLDQIENIIGQASPSTAASKISAIVQLQLSLFLEGEEKKKKLEKLEIFLQAPDLEGVNHIKATVQFQLFLFEEEKFEKQIRLDNAQKYLEMIPDSLPHSEYAAIKARVLFEQSKLSLDKSKAQEALKVLTVIPEEERTAEERDVLSLITQDQMGLLQGAQT